MSQKLPIEKRYEIIWDEIKEPLLKSVVYAKTNQQLSISQRQAIIKAIIKLLEQKDED